jgi:nifR3 family TIM-barrel protein
MKISNLQLKNNVFLAPMAGITDLPFRTIARSFGCGIAFTEMISGIGLVRKTQKTLRYIGSNPSDRPLGIQVFGNDPEVLAEAALTAERYGADLIDLNMGCPVKKVTKTGAGAALMKDPLRAGAVMREMRKATSLPLTLKIRSGWNARQINALEIGRIAEDSGFDAVTLHPRTADQGYSGRANRGLIGELKECLHIPVIGSGDIHTPQDAGAMLSETGCDAVMVGRGALGNPWIIANIISYLSGGEVSFPSLSEREAIIIRHLGLSVDFFGEHVGIRDFRKHLLWYTKGLKGSARFREEAGQIRDRDSAIKAMRDYFRIIGNDTAASMTSTSGNTLT